MVFLEYGRAMQQAHLFEAALQFIAAMELEASDPTRNDDPLARTEWFFSRPISWLARRLDFPPEMVQEIDDLRQQRNRLAHGYLARIELTEEDDEGGQDAAESAIVAAVDSVRRDIVEELRTLTTRFKNCNSQLYERSLVQLPYVADWDTAEKLARDPSSNPRT